MRLNQPVECKIVSLLSFVQKDPRSSLTHKAQRFAKKSQQELTPHPPRTTRQLELNTFTTISPRSKCTTHDHHFAWARQLITRARAFDSIHSFLVFVYNKALPVCLPLLLCVSN